MELPKPNGDKKGRWAWFHASGDVWLQRGAWIAQIVLVFAAIAGYILTVQPVRQKQLLDEQIADRNIALRDATTELSQLRTEASRLRQDNERLSKDSEQVYKQLRSNVILELQSASTRCGFVTDAARFDPQQVVECVLKYARGEVITKLRDADKARLDTLLEMHRQDLLNASRGAAKQYSSKAKQVSKIIRDLNNASAKGELDLLADIRQHRQAKGHSETSLASIKDIQVEDEYEREALIRFLFKRDDLVLSLYMKQVDQIEHDTAFASSQMDAIRGVLDKVIREFRQ